MDKRLDVQSTKGSKGPSGASEEVLPFLKKYTPEISLKLKK